MSITKAAKIKRKKSTYKTYIKRPLDIICSGIALIMLMPVLVMTAVLVRVKLGSPVIFKQVRPGLGTRSFVLYKFRTMTDKKDKNGSLLPDEIRLTSFGRKLRSTSLDELPELWNIFRGDMSLVGPRPLLVEYLPYYTEEEMHRHDVRPGLTGWAQVNGRNVTAWDERLKQDIDYVEHCTFFMDCKILFMTVSKVIKRTDILVGAQYSSNHGRLDTLRKKQIQREVVHK